MQFNALILHEVEINFDFLSVTFQILPLEEGLSSKK